MGFAGCVGCPIWGSCSGLLASCPAPWWPTNTKLWSLDTALRELSVVDPSFAEPSLLGEAERDCCCACPAAKRAIRSLSAEASWELFLGGGCGEALGAALPALLALPQVL